MPPASAVERDRDRRFLDSRVAPWAGVLLALVVRLIAHRHQPFVTVDGTEYIRLAESLLRGHPFASIFPPGYPALIAIARLVIADRVLAAAVVSIACGALLAVPVWHLARRAVGDRWAVLPMMAVALHPELARISTVAMSESSYLLALYGAVALAAAGRPLGAGLAAGAAFAIRPEGLVTAAALAIREGMRLWFPGTARTARSAMDRIGSPFRLVAGVLVMAIPCWLYFHATLGVWTVSPKIGALRAPVTAWRAEEPRLAPRGDSAAAFALGDRLVRFGPSALAHYPRNARLHLGQLLPLWPLPLLALALLGLARRRGVEALPLLGVAAIPLLAITAQPRFMLPAIPALAILATVPLAASAGASRPERAVRALAALGWLAGAVWCAVLHATSFRQPFDADLADHVDAGRWLARHSSAGDIVLDRKPYVAFYADRTYRVIPDEPYDTILVSARRTGARFLVMAEGVARIFRPQLLPLVLDPAARAREARVELVYVTGRRPGHDVSVFRILGAGESPGRAPPDSNVHHPGVARP
jgi:hypothetical protein